MQADDGRWDKDLASHMQLHKDQPVGIVKSFDAQPEFHFHGSCCRQGGRVLEQNEAARGSVLNIMPRDIIPLKGIPENIIHVGPEDT